MSTDYQSSTRGLSTLSPANLALSLAGLAIAYYLATKIYSVFFGPLSRYPGPKSFAWTRIALTRRQMLGLDAETLPALHAKYGPVVRVAPDELSFTSPQAWQDIYGFHRAGQPKNHKDPKFVVVPFNGVHSLISADDANHARQRKILSNAFADRSIKDQEPLLKRWAGRLVQRLAERASTGQKLDLLKFYNCTTFDIMGELTFSENLNLLEESDYSPWVTAIFGGIKQNSLLRGVRELHPLARLFVNQVLLKLKSTRKSLQEHFKFSSDRVDRRLSRTPAQPDLWTRILEKSHGSEGLSIGEHHSIASLFMIAGTETTATALSGTTYHLLRNPAAMQKLVSEIRGAFSSFDNLTLDSVQRLRYLHAVLQEGLRMYPPVPVTLPRRTPEGGAAICGEWVPGNTAVGVHHLATYRSEQNFKHAHEFHPERWLQDPEFKDDRLEALEPFHVGPRNCIGKNLAWHEMRLLLVTVLLAFDLELCKESDAWANQKVYLLWEKVPLYVKLTPAKATA